MYQLCKLLTFLVRFMEPGGKELMDEEQLAQAGCRNDERPSALKNQPEH